MWLYVHLKSSILVTYDDADAVSEACALCDAAGYGVRRIIRQQYLMRPKYGVSEEVVERLEEEARSIEPDVIVYDEILRPSQNYNLASRLRRNILDRESLILEIFESRASSMESRLQVKLAQMRYELGRAREKVRLARLGEQPGFMGIGRFEVDTYHNDIRYRMNSVRKKLQKAGKQRGLHREGRKRQGLMTASLAGYTSAGKTTLFNALTGESKEHRDELFTTLSTTTRRMDTDGDALLVSDTVGFISKLPAYMIDAFRSTLEELVHADVIIMVIDASDSATHVQRKFRSCRRTLAEIGADDKKMIFVLNKSDVTDADDMLEKARILGLAENRKCVTVSAHTQYNMDALKSLIRDMAFMTARGPGSGGHDGD